MPSPIITVVYSHGRFGSPWYGFKIEALRGVALQMGMNIVSVRYPEEMAVEEMEAKLLRTVSDDVIVPGDLVFLSSSRGGYLSTRVANDVIALYASEPDRVDEDKPLPRRHVLGQFLIAPAFYIKPDYYPDQSPAPPCGMKTVIVHGLDDNVIASDNSVRFAQRFKAELHLVAGGHRLNSQRDLLCTLFEEFLRECATNAECHYSKWLDINPQPDSLSDDVGPGGRKNS